MPKKQPKKQEPDFNEVKSENITDNDTWNTCPVCQKKWRDPVSVPGLLHRTKTCDDCMGIMYGKSH